MQDRQYHQYYTHDDGSQVGQYGPPYHGEKALAINIRMVYINKGEHDNPHELPKEYLEGSLDTIYTDYTHTDIPPKLPEEIEKLEYIYQHFQDREKIHETNLQVTTEQTDVTLYPHINNDIEYGLFENVLDSYYLDSQIRDGFTCTKACYTCNTTASTSDTNPQCTHT